MLPNIVNLVNVLLWFEYVVLFLVITIYSNSLVFTIFYKNFIYFIEKHILFKSFNKVLIMDFINIFYDNKLINKS